MKYLFVSLLVFSCFTVKAQKADKVSDTIATIKLKEPEYICNEEGKVVVEIIVDRSGKVIEANPGIEGTTNKADCLLEQAKNAALNTTWTPDPEAPERQVGKIIYDFKLNE